MKAHTGLNLITTASATSMGTGMAKKGSSHTTTTAIAAMTGITDTIATINNFIRPLPEQAQRLFRSLLLDPQ